MSRLILAENVYRVIQKEFDDWHISYTVGQEMMDRIKEIPDGLVRCKDCKCLRFYEDGTWWCEQTEREIINPNWFCADGERKVQG